MSKRIKPWWIKERWNPQLGRYYVACGQMSKTSEKKCERSLYGHNVMHQFDAEDEYDGRIAELKKRKERVQ